MTDFRSPMRPDYPGNRKEGEVSKARGPAGHDAKVTKTSVAWSDMTGGPPHHEDQKAGSGDMNAYGKAGDAHGGMRGPSPTSTGHSPNTHLSGVESRKSKKATF
jgi:hypothetical protein